MSSEAHFTSEADNRELHHKTHDHEFARRVTLMVVGVVIAIGLGLIAWKHRVVGDEAAVAAIGTAVPGDLNGQRVNAWRLTDYPGVLKSKAELPSVSKDGRGEWLWLGNSQLHMINQPKPGEMTAPVLASRSRGLPVWGLSLPNAYFVENLGVAAWALNRRDFDLVVLPLVFDDLRNDEYRPGWEAISDDRWRTELGKYETGRFLLSEIDKNVAAEDRDAQGTTRSALAFSAQDWCEKKLEALMDALVPVWRNRDQMYAAVVNAAYGFRNSLFNIKSSSKRAMIGPRYERNMKALNDILAHCKGRVPLLVYVAPTRWTPEPPYVISEYEAWKVKVAEICRQQGAVFADLDRLVDSPLFGEVNGEPDFMHFQERGHRLLADEIVRLGDAMLSEKTKK